jgi:MFS transporter, UMF1 family
MEFQKNQPKVIRAWALYDWANSAYNLVITSAVFPAYFLAVTDPNLEFLGLNMTNSGLYAFSVSFAFLVIAFLSPILSGIADSGGIRKKFMFMFFTIGSISCISMYWFKGMEQLEWGVWSFIFASIGFAGSIVFYNSFLPQIVTQDKYDRVSAIGYSYGYVGSVSLLLIILACITFYEKLGFPTKGDAIRLGFLLVGVWWFSWAQIPMLILPADAKTKFSWTNALPKGYKELIQVFNELKHLINTKRYLLFYFFSAAGVQTVIYLAATFAEKELHFETQELIIVILLIQFLGIVGAYFFAWISEKIGNVKSMAIMIFIWLIICVIAYLIKGKTEFYFVAALVGSVMGGVQALARSSYAKLIPSETKDTASYFSFFDSVEKFAIVIGTFSFGFIEQMTGSLRNSVLALMVYFIIALILLIRVKIPKNIEAA